MGLKINTAVILVVAIFMFIAILPNSGFSLTCFECIFELLDIGYCNTYPDSDSCIACRRLCCEFNEQGDYVPCTPDPPQPPDLPEPQPYPEPPLPQPDPDYNPNPESVSEPVLEPETNPEPEPKGDSLQNGTKGNQPEDISPKPDDPDTENPHDDTSAMKRDPVYLKTGELYYHTRDLVIRGRALDVVIERHYRSKSEYNSAFGYGWDMNYNCKVRRLGNDSTTIVFLTGKNGRKQYSQSSNPNKYTNPSEPGDFFRYNGDETFTLVKKHGTEWDFDSNGNLTTITDRNNNSITFEYDPNGLMPVYGASEFFLSGSFGGPSTGRGIVAMAYRLKTITDDLGRKIELSYDGNGLLSKITDFAGRTWIYFYGFFNTNMNNPIAVTGPANERHWYSCKIYTYDDDGNLDIIFNHFGDGVYLENNYGNDKVTSQVYGYDNEPYTFSYNPDSNEATMTDPEGFECKTVYNDAGNIVSDTIDTEDLRPGDPDSYATSYEYDSIGQVTRKIFPGGNCIDYAYDPNGNITAVYRKAAPDEPNDPNDPDVIAAFYTYDPNFNFIKTATDPMGNVTSYDYDPNGNLESITYPDVNTPYGLESPVVSFVYNQFGQLETAQSPDDIITKYVYYDANDPNDPNCGRLWKVIVDYNETDPDALNITSEYRYDILGNVIEANDPNGNITQFAYNNLSQLIQVIDPCDYATDMGWYRNAKLSYTRKTLGSSYQITQYNYIDGDKLAKITNPLNYCTNFGYDDNGNLSDVNDAEGNITGYEYDERDLLWKATDANGQVTEYSYTDNGLIAEINDPNGNITTFEYDGFDRLTCINYPDDTNELFGYDKNSNVTSYTNRNGDVIQYQYDALNRMIVKNRPGEPNIEILYDIAGRKYDVNDLRSVSEGGGLTEYYYDRIGRLSDINDPHGRLVSYEYNSRSLRTKLTYPDDSYITYEYDALGRLRKIRDDSSSLLAEYTYGQLGRRTLLTLGNDANAVYEYDLADRLRKLTNNVDDATEIVFDYANYDKVGNRLSCKVDETEAQVYTYDCLYQLIFVDYNDGNSTDYYYDVLGNRTSVVNGGTTIYDSNCLNQYTSVGGTGYSYDDNGNLTNDGTYLYYYDCENRLTEVNDINDSPVASYKYDYLGRRVSKTVDSTTTKYCYDGDQIIAEYDGNDTLLRKFIYGPGIDEPVMMIDVTTSAKYYYHFDGLGSVIAVSDSGGNMVERYSYDVFGEPNRISDVNNPYFFTGRRLDTETSNYYYRARYYKPSIGRFLQTDPIRYDDGLNMYTYVGSNPINFVDPFGLCEEDGDTRYFTAFAMGSPLASVMRQSGIAWDDQGNVGWINTTGLGLGTPSATLGFAWAGTNASSIYDFDGSGGSTGVSFVVPGEDVIFGENYVGIERNLSLIPGFPEGHIHRTHTTVYPLFNYVETLEAMVQYNLRLIWMDMLMHSVD